MMVRVTKTEGDILNGKWGVIAIQCSVVMILEILVTHTYFIFCEGNL